MKTKTLILVEKDVTASLPPTESLASETLEEAACTGTTKPCEESIRQRAYEQWQAAGCPEGDGVEFWLEAEREVASQATPGAESKVSHEFDDTVGF